MTGSTRDIGAAIDDGAWTGAQKAVLALAALAFVVDALANQVMAISIPAMMRDWHVGRPAFSPVLAMGWVGVAVGTVVAGTLADRFGRKTMLLASILLFGIATAAGAYVADIDQLLILRTIDGLGIGGAIPTATSLIAEFTPARRRSRAINIGMICIPLGNFLCGAIGSVVLKPLGWRSLFTINGSLSIVVCLVLLIALPESPRFLSRQAERGKELARVMTRLVGSPADTHWVDAARPRTNSPLSALFGPETLVTTLAIWAGFFFCFLGVYSSLNWMPALLSGKGYSLGVASLALSMAGIGGMAGSIVMAKLIESLGSRWALIIAAIGAAMSAVALIMLPLDPAANIVPLMVALAAMSMSLNGLTGCIYSLAAFVYPPFAKGTGLGAAGAVGRIGAIVSSYAAVAVLAMGSPAFFAFIAAGGVVAVAFLMIVRNHIPSDTVFVRGAAAVHEKSAA